MFTKRKRGLSEIVAYVILISITFAVAGMVFAWLRFYVTSSPELKCEDGTSLSLRQVSYNCTSKELNLTIQNRGLFDINGYIVRVSNLSKANIGIYTLNVSGEPLSTGENYNDYYTQSNKTYTNSAIKGILTLVEIQPWVIQGNTTVYCQDVAQQYLSC